MQADHDTVELEVSGRRIENFYRYRVESDLFKAADDFSMTFEDPGIDILPGDRCRVLVNGVLEMTGIIDRVQDEYGGDDTRLTVSGRDLMGLLVDSHVGLGRTDQNIELKALAQDLLKDVPYINRKSIIYGKGDKSGVSETGGLFFEMAKAQREPGKSIFDTLSQHARERGLLFWCQPDGTFVFGMPVRKGKPSFRLVTRMDGVGNNILDAERVRDISGRYSKVTVFGQQQGEDIFGADEINRSATAVDDTFPFYKPFCSAMSQDMTDPGAYAAMILNQQRYAGFQLTYTVDGHSQQGKNYQANTLCWVTDEFFGYDQAFFVSARTFELGHDGISTRLRLSEPGVVPA